MDVRLLGSLQVLTADGAALDLGGRNQRAVLAVLLSRRGSSVPRDHIVDAVWSERLPADPANVVQHYVSRLRRVLGADVVERTDAGYRVVLEPGKVDVERFHAGVRAATDARRSGALEEAERGLHAALGEWRGRPYASLDIDALEPEIRGLEHARLDATEDLVDVRLALGRHRECIPDLERLVTEHPFRERFWAQLMIALYRSGRQAESLRAFGRARHALLDALGIDPGGDLRALEARILAGDPTLDADERTRHGGVSGVGRMPVPPTGFVGRDSAVAAVVPTVGHAPVTTILGSGGVGKTRLAIEVANRIGSQFGDGVVFVALDGITDGDAAVRAIAAATGMRERPQRLVTGALAEWLADRDVLVVLDGCEGVTAACADVAERVQRRGGRAALLATSTVVLGVEGEARFDVPPMGARSSAGEDGDGHDLFVERARLVVPGWEPTPVESELIDRIVVAADGSPLAIELAAACLDVHSLSEVATDVEWEPAALGLTSVAGFRPAAERSIGELDDDVREFYTRLSVFTHGFDRDAARQVGMPPGTAADPAEHLALLARRSLVRADRSVDGVRYVVPPALRELVWSSLVESDACAAVRDAHAAWIRDLVLRAEPELRGPDLDRWIRRLDREHANVRRALEWNVERGDPATLQQLVAALCRYWDWTGRFSEAGHWVHRVGALPPSPGDDAHALTWIAVWAVYFATEAGDTDDALRLADVAIDKATATGDLDQATAAWGNRGLVHRARGELRAALEAGRRALAVADGGADRWFVAWAASALAVTRHEAGEYDAALDNAQRALAGFRRLGDRASEAWALDAAARATLGLGDPAGAEEQARHALLNGRLLGARRTVASTLDTLALIAARRGEMERAVSLVSAARTVVTSRTVRAAGESIVADAAKVLAPGAYAAAWELGRTHDLDSLLATPTPALR